MSARISSPGGMAAVRLDKWLWVARLFKNRSLATRACQAGKVRWLEAGRPHARSRAVKPSRSVEIGAELQISRQLYRQHVRVTGLAEKRGSAKVAATLFRDLTSPEDVTRARLQGTRERAMASEQRRAGRPNKRERRTLQDLSGKF